MSYGLFNIEFFLLLSGPGGEISGVGYEDGTRYRMYDGQYGAGELIEPRWECGVCR